MEWKREISERVPKPSNNARPRPDNALKSGATGRSKNVKEATRGIGVPLPSHKQTEATRCRKETQNDEEAGLDVRPDIPDAPHTSVRKKMSRITTSNYNLSLQVPTCMAINDTARSMVSNIVEEAEKFRDPPVTIATLKELDLASIQSNLNLRVDIPHDPELYFQPISGTKGEAKRSDATKYWSALAVEFLVYRHNALSGCQSCQNTTSPSNIWFRPRLPTLFDQLRQIVTVLVPDADHEEVQNHLDTGFLMQQVHMGALDAARLSTWLSKLLTLHCAPMRDDSAAEVADEICNSTEKADMEALVKSLEKLFGLLEAMKLDVANHQIRAFRYVLIEDTVRFQQDCFSRAIESQQMDVTKSKQWFMRACESHRDMCAIEIQDQASMDFASFVHGLVHLCRPGVVRLPSTFQYDHHRFMRLQEDLQDHVQTSLCLAVFNNQVLEVVGAQCQPSRMHKELKQRILRLTEDDHGNGGAISDHLDAIGMEITRAAFAMATKSKSRSRSPSSSDFDRTVKLLHDVFHEEDAYQVMTQEHLVSLEERTMHFIRKFSLMTTLDISNSQKHWAQARLAKENLLADWDGMARKIAHIGVVHWRVWEHLCYGNAWDSDSEDELDSFDSIVAGVENGFRDQPLSALPPAEDCNMDLDHSTASGNRMAAMHTCDAPMQRQDSGFAEMVDEIDCTSDIDSEGELRRRGTTPSNESTENKSNGKRLSGLR